jgi:hypothetical protein
MRCQPDALHVQNAYTSADETVRSILFHSTTVDVLPSLALHIQPVLQTQASGD